MFTSDVHLILLALALPAICNGIYKEAEKQMELQSAVMMNQLALSQQAEVLKEVLNSTRRDHCSSCYAEGLAKSLESLVSLIKAAEILIDKSNPSKQRKGCPYPYTEVVNECYYAHTKKLTWLQARRVCRGMGGDLAEPRHLYALQTYLAVTFGPSYFWIGGSDLEEPGSWRWVSGRPLEDEDWLFARPDNLGGDEHCLEIVMSDYPKLFNDETCSVLQRFICQYNNEYDLPH